METVVENRVGVSDEEKRMGFLGWDEAAQQVCCDVGETRESLEGSLQAVRTKRYV